MRNPAPSCETGTFELDEADAPSNGYGSSLDHEWGSCVMQGHRNHMEDRLITQATRVWQKGLITSKIARIPTEHKESKDSTDSKLQIQSISSVGIISFLEVIAETRFQVLNLNF